MNAVYLLVVVGFFLCVLAVRAVDILRKFTHSIHVQQIASETQTIGMMAAILMAGRLANPHYREELAVLRDELDKARESEREFREAHDLPPGEESELAKCCRDLQRDMHRADVFHWEGQKHLVGLARDAYRNAGSERAKLND